MSNQYLFDNYIPLGPENLESWAESRIGHNIQGGLNRYPTFLKFFESIKIKYNKTSDIHFILAYFNQQAAYYQPDSTQKEIHLKESLLCYHRFLHFANDKKPDESYFAQWQIGELLQTLGYSWGEIEPVYLNSLEYDLTRGEAFKPVLYHHISQRNWRIAYLYSSYCVTHFLFCQPRHRYWNVDENFYNWKLLKFHIPILLSIRKPEEAQQHLINLIKRKQEHPELFSEKDRSNIDAFLFKMENSLTHNNSVQQ